MTVGRIAPRLRRSRKNVMPSSNARLRNDRHEQRQAEDEEHRIGVDQIVEPRERQQVLRDPDAASRCCAISTCHVDVGSPQNVATMTSSIP